ncbi:MAG: hypothetical protein LBC97_07380 [Bifidobacteriaceae bacterium]|nr:hypothetical protein [Bifidobacteriaceae bacterium]
MGEPIWLEWPLGTRVTIRRRLPEGGYADTVGVLEAASPDHVEVRHRSGDLRRIDASVIAIAHRIPGPAGRSARSWLGSSGPAPSGGERHKH